MKKFFDERYHVTEIKNIIRVSAEASTSVHPNRHCHGIVLFLKEGSYYQFGDGKEYFVKENGMIYLPKHSDYTSTDKENAVCIAINFDIGDDETAYEPFVLAGDFGGKYADKFRKILMYWKEQRIGYQSKCFSLMYDILFQIQEDNNKKYMVFGQRKKAEEICMYIHRNLANEDLSVQNMAREFQMTPEYLRKIFKNYKGVSPMEYILNKRIESAKQLIRSGEVKLSAVPFDCGFNDYPYFSRAFKKVTGVSPLKYLKSVAEEGNRGE